MRKFALSRHEMSLMVFAMGMCLRALDEDDPEMKSIGFTRDDVLGICGKLGVRPQLITATEMEIPDNDWKEDNK